ncbi:MAG: ATP synthase F1 subunit delta [Holophaga sp.]|nr:ATP synthase F1 subunit delta [Holophaga sp.]
MSHRLVARRYAMALAGIAADQGTLVPIQEELAAVATLVRGNPDLERLAFYPLLAPSQKAKAMDAVLEAGGFSPILRQFFGVVARAARLDLVYELATAFDELVDARLGVVEARVETAQPMSEAQSAALAAALSRRTGKTVKLKWRQDPSVLGGVRAQVGSTVYDASLKGQLRLLQARLLSA